jgi:hypothetical protein
MNTPNLGKAVAHLIVGKLVQDNRVSVIERSAIDKLLAEQNLSNSDRGDPVTAAKLGRVLCVDAIIPGTITHYEYEDKMTGGGHSRFGGFGGPSMSTKHDIKAKVQITSRPVSPDTAEVMSYSEGVGEVNRKGVKVDANYPTLNECMDKAVVQLAGELEQAVPKVPQHVPAVDGLVADANDAGRLILNVGVRQGVKTGDRLQVWRAGKEIRDAATGKVLLRDDTLLGDTVVTIVNDISSIAEYKGAEKPNVGDLVKSIPKQ